MHKHISDAHSVAEIAALYADQVDEQARFPVEAVGEMKRRSLLGITMPGRLGGAGLNLIEAMQCVSIVSRRCASSGMILAMHHSVAAVLRNHGGTSAWHEDLARQVAFDSLLLAGATTETGTGGDVARSVTALQRDGDRFVLTKDASVISYGEYADYILVSARSNVNSSSTDQVFVPLARTDLKLEARAKWNGMGMRGTCSSSFQLEGRGRTSHIMPEPFDDIHFRTAMPWSHYLWSAVWIGIATDALTRARSYLRKKTPTAHRLNYSLFPAASQLQTAKSSLVNSASCYLERFKSTETGDRISEKLEYNSVKTQMSVMCRGIVIEALDLLGLQGYQHGGQYSVSRHVRDILSAPLMISNLRILGNMAALSVLREAETGCIL